MSRGVLPRRVVSSAVMCAGLLITYLVLPNADAETVFFTAACGAGVSIAFGVLLETGPNIRNIIRIDLLMIVALYGLTLVEFLFPQEGELLLMSTVTATHGVEALFIGFLGLVVGRLFISQTNARRGYSQGMPDFSPSTIFRLYILVFMVGYLHMLIAVSFNPIELVWQFLQPRFSQPWGRGSLGGLDTVLGELGNLALYLVPAISGAALADRRRFNKYQLTIFVFGIVFTLFYAFASGTRNVFAILLLMFFGSFALRARRLSAQTALIGVSSAALLLYFSAYHMLQFRRAGLASYLTSSERRAGHMEETLFVDYNLPVISRLTEVFPQIYQYLGAEVVYFALIRPIPRALWPGKPEGISVEAADALGLSGVALASTFVGEAYMMAGYAGILGVAVFFGAFGSWWEKRQRNLRSQLTIALYVSGFLAALISMRSLYWFTTALLPAVGMWFYLQYRKSRQGKTVHRAGQRRKY